MNDPIHSSIPLEGRGGGGQGAGLLIGCELICY